MISILFQRPVIKRQQAARMVNFRTQLLNEVFTGSLCGSRLHASGSRFHQNLLLVTSGMPHCLGTRLSVQAVLGNEEVVSCNHFSASEHPSRVRVERVQDGGLSVSEEVRESVWP